MTVAQQKRLLRRTIARLEVYSNKVGINYFLAEGKTGAMAIDSDFMAKDFLANGHPKNNVIPFKSKKPTDSNLSVPCSRVFKSGDLTPS